MAVSKEEVIEFLSGLTVLEAAALVKELEEKWGVTASAPVAAVAVAGPAAAAEEQTSFDCSRNHGLGLERSQGSRRRHAEDNQGRRFQGRSSRN